MPQKTVTPYKPKFHIRIVTAASLFDGHDVAINIMRRMIQSTGVEVIHLGHNRSVQEIVDCAIQEDAQSIAITSYQGGHIEFFKYMHDLLKERGAGHIKIFGGGGGTILPEEIEELLNYGIDRIYSPDDGRKMGLQGMINDLVKSSDFPIGQSVNGELKELQTKNPNAIARVISAAENFPEDADEILTLINKRLQKVATPVLGITGTGGSGKSSLVDELVRRFLIDFEDKTIAIISVDPSKRKTGGALLGDRIRMNSINSDRVYMRSLATRQSNLALSKYVREAVNIVKVAEYDLIILETSGIGQSDTEIIEHSDLSLYVMTPEYGAATQLEKIDMLDFADIIALNKFDKRGAMDALRDVRKQYKRNHQLWDVEDEALPVYGTIASQFNDPGMNRLYVAIMDGLVNKTNAPLKPSFEITDNMSVKIHIIPPNRIRYLSEIADENRDYNKKAKEQKEVAQKLFSLRKTIETIQSTDGKEKESLIEQLEETYKKIALDLASYNKNIIEKWPEKVKRYQQDFNIYHVRGKEIKVKTYEESLSHTKIPKISLPRYEAWGDVLYWSLLENVPGEFPFTAGVYPYKREGEDPTRMFAGEGGPERTNRRFHYVSMDQPGLFP